MLDDSNRRIVNVFDVQRDPHLSIRLRDALCFTPYAEQEFLRAREPSTNPMEDAQRTLAVFPRSIEQASESLCRLMLAGMTRQGFNQAIRSCNGSGAMTKLHHRSGSTGALALSLPFWLRQPLAAISDAIAGVSFVAIFAAAASYLAGLEPIHALSLSPLVIGLVMGIFYANTLHDQTPDEWRAGIAFSAKQVLRIAIVLYGFRITFQDVGAIGVDGFAVSLIMLSSTLIFGSWLGRKVCRLDAETSLLTSAGAAICGAAAVLATESVLRSKTAEHKAVIAVAMVVSFGTLAMFLYPLIWKGIASLPTSSWMHMDARTFGIYVGGTIHEVAQVVAVPASIPGSERAMADSAVIVKMTRVLLLAPTLLLLSVHLSRSETRSLSTADKTGSRVPRFALYFLAVVGMNSLYAFPHYALRLIDEFDTFLLTIAMTAIGMSTVFSKFKGVGARPFIVALGLFLWLSIGGFFVTQGVTHLTRTIA